MIIQKVNHLPNNFKKELFEEINNFRLANGFDLPLAWDNIMFYISIKNTIYNAF